MLNQFSRTELVFGKEAMEILKRSRVAVFGIGGVGGYTVEALAYSGTARKCTQRRDIPGSTAFVPSVVHLASTAATAVSV